MVDAAVVDISVPVLVVVAQPSSAIEIGIAVAFVIVVDYFVYFIVIIMYKRFIIVDC